MRMVISFILLSLFAGVSGMLIFLNQEKTAFVLTPTFKGVYYTLPEMPLGLLVVLSLLLGFLLGYVVSFLSRLIK
ncbi:MAG: hypothetical protein ACK4OF_03345 [Aquificaceae bacterium]